jgi:hypothetical protein
VREEALRRLGQQEQLNAKLGGAMLDFRTEPANEPLPSRFRRDGD